MTETGGPDTAPPFVAARLLAAMLSEEDRDAVVQELQELYEIQCARRGVAGARLWYRRHAAVFIWRLLRHGRRRGVRASGSRIERAMARRERTGGGVDMIRLIDELRQSSRRLVRAPVFTVVSVLTIGVGIGAFTSIFGLVEAVLLEPMPYEEPDELVWVWRDYVTANFPRGWLGGPDIVGMREQSAVFAGVVAFRSNSVNLTDADGGGPVQVTVNLASHELFDVLGVRPALGRGFQPDDDVPNGPRVAILAHDFWVRQFASDPTLVGSTITINATAVEVIGVAPEGFRFAKAGSLSDPVSADIYQPLQTDLATMDPGAGSYAGLARVRPDVHPDQVEAALAAAVEQTNIVFSDRGGSPVRLWTVGVKDDLVEGVRPALTALVASAGFLLLILSANLATMLLGRAATREHELGIRIALGAGRPRVLTSVLTESALIAVLGGGVGLLLATVGTDVVAALAPDDLPRLAAVDVDASVLGVAVLVTAVMALSAGLAPALYALRASITVALEEGGARSGGGVRGTRARSSLVAAQVALSLMLLVGAGLVAQAFAGLLRQDPGFDPAETLTFSVPLPSAVYADRAAVRRFHDELRGRLAAVSGVAAVGATTALPLTQETDQMSVGFPGAPGNVEDESDTPLIDWFRVTPGYFEAAGHRLLSGRGFQEADADTTSMFIIIIDDVLARRFFPDGRAVGSQAVFAGDTATVVGVVDQARLYNVHADDRGQVYIPFQRFPTNDLAYAVRTELEPLSLVAGARGVMAGLDASIPMARVRTLSGIVDESLGQQRLSLTLILAFALGALLLATLGIYGVVANGVVRRTREIGVRIALGADSERVVGMVLGQGLRLSTVGAALGVVGALAASRLLEGVMVGVEARDPTVYVAVAVGLIVVAAAASYVPARRATRIDPVVALRPE